MASPEQKKAALSTLQCTLQKKQLQERAEENQRMMAELKAAEQAFAEKQRGQTADASPAEESTHQAPTAEGPTSTGGQEPEPGKRESTMQKLVRTELRNSALETELAENLERCALIEARAVSAEEQLESARIELEAKAALNLTRLQQVAELNETVAAEKAKSAEASQTAETLSTELNARDKETEYAELMTARKQLETQNLEIGKITKQLREMEISLEWSTASNEQLKGELQGFQLTMND